MNLKYLNELTVAEGVDINNPIHQQNLAEIDAVFEAVNRVLEHNFPATDFSNMPDFLASYTGKQRAIKRKEFIDMVKNLRPYEIGNFDNKFLIKTGACTIEEAGPYVQKLEKLAIAFSQKHAKITHDELEKISAYNHFKLAVKKLFRRKK